MKNLSTYTLPQRSRIALALAAALPLTFGIAPVPAHAAFDYQTGEVIAPTAGYAYALSNNGQVVAFSDGTFLNLTTMTATASGVFAYALSDDGSVVLTQDYTVGAQAALWRAGTGLQLLGWLPGDAGSFVNKHGLSADGTVVAGTSSFFGDSFWGPRQAFRWTQASGMVGLGHLGGGDESWTNALSADGSTVVGGANTLAGDTRAFRWTAATNMQDLGTLGGATAEAQAVSANGAVVAGISVNGLGRSQLFRWTSADGMVSLGDLGGDVYSAMMGRDGNAITGYSATATGGTGYYWTQASGMVDMLASAPAGFDYVNPRAISANGMVVVGQSNEGFTPRAFRYTLAGGFQTVEAWLAASGVAVGSWKLSTATAVNEDGSVIVGEAFNYSTNKNTGFIARGLGTAAPPCVGCFGVIDIVDYNRTLQGAAYIPVQMIGEADIVLHGAHGSPMRGRPATGKGNVWVSGDWGQQENVGRDGDIGAGEIGGAWGFASGVTAKMALGRTYSRQDLIFNGKTVNRGTYIVPELIVDLPDTPFTFSASGYYNDGKLDADRGYENTGTPVISKGSADSRTAGLRLRVDWHGAVTHGDFQLNPYASATHYRTKLDGYTENGGGFPVRWDERTERTTLARLGADATQALNSDWTLIGRLEGVHRIDRRSTNATGQVIGLSAFDFEGLNYKRDWLRASIGVEGKLGTGYATVMLNTSTETNGPTHWGYASYRIDF